MMKGGFKSKLSLLRYLVRGGVVLSPITSNLYRLEEDYDLKVVSVLDPSIYWSIQYFLNHYKSYIKNK